MSATENTPVIPVLTRKDFSSDISVKWCPGCGDFNILMAIQNLMPKLGKKKEDFAFISGIGCSSRFPYYMNTFGFHTIHGRAPAIATGVKTANPDLDVWMVTGDGDALSIGGNHFIHAIRRNQDIKILLFNNRIYGLTKGQFSPTSAQGIKTGSSPFGSVDYPMNPLAVAISAGATFVARTSDNDPKHMEKVFAEAAEHKGIAVIEIMQNCVIFNDKVHDDYYGRKTRSDTLMYIEDGEPLVWGKTEFKGLFLDGFAPAIKELEADNTEGILVHKASSENTSLAFTLSQLEFPDFPVPVGVFRKVSKPSFSELVDEQIAEVKNAFGEGNLEDVLNSGTTWTVE
jgi:2-oxoglutarate/2-oxoacid ferredoxin oxidoreductase subunit beta